MGTSIRIHCSESSLDAVPTTAITQVGSNVFDIRLTCDIATTLLAADIDLDLVALSAIGEFLDDPEAQSHIEQVPALPIVAEIPGRYVGYDRNREELRLWASDPEGYRLLESVLGPHALDRRSKAWFAPSDAERAGSIVSALANAGFGWSIDAQAMLGEVIDIAERRLQGATSLSPRNSSLVIPGLNGELMPYQIAGVEYLLDSRRAILGDTMGLGKTVQALSTLASAGTYPAVIVCPAALRVNWSREIRQWFPKVFSVTITSGKPHSLKGADVVIISYDLLSRHLNDLKALQPQAAIFDESHFIKDTKAKRTKAAKALSKSVGAKGLVLCLSGTPVVNRPVELVGQLEVLDRLKEFGGYWPFVKRYCDAKETRWGWDTSGSSNSEELLQRMRANCYLRRRKSDVLHDLPAKRHAHIDIEVDTDTEVTLKTADGEEYTTTYRALEEDFVSAMVGRAVEIANRNGEDPESAAVEAEIRAEAREHFGKAHDLHYAIGMTKIPEVIEWTKSFLDDGQDENSKILVFAHHRRVLEAINNALQEYGSAIIWGGQDPKTRQRAVDNFQTHPESRVLVCSIKAAGVGLNLTAASDVLFAQPIWTPAEMAQAEDRSHRLGQTNPVTIWQMVASGTVEERIYRLLETKSEVVGSITDGDPQGVLSDLVLEMSKQRLRGRR